MIEIHRLCKSYWRARVKLPVIRDLTLRIARGEFVAIMQS
jgi:ABC-type lipoprotein export system ATPase subunit